MIIKNIYNPKVSGNYSAEEIIYRRGVGDFYAELRDVILNTSLEITDTPRKKATGFLSGLAGSMNKAMGSSLTSLGWGVRQAPGAANQLATTDWSKMKPSGLAYTKPVGLAVEIQFGNNYQFHADVQRFAEEILQGEIVAGISIVASDEFAKYKSDRGAAFSNSKAKLERWLGILAESGAILLPSIVIIGIQHDSFLTSEKPEFHIHAPIYDLSKTNGVLTPVSFLDFVKGSVESVSDITEESET